MDQPIFPSVIGWELKSLMADQLTATLQKGAWTYTMAEPVLGFRLHGDARQSMFWKLTWLETDEGDDTLRITATSDVDEIPYYLRIEGFSDPCVIASTIKLDEAVIDKVTGSGFQYEEEAHLTALVFHTSIGCVTIETGSGMLMTVSIAD